MAAFTLVAWHHLHYLHSWPQDGATCVSSKFDHQRAPFELVPNLTTRWRQLHWLQNLTPDSPNCITCQFSSSWHHLHCLLILPPDGTTCIGLKFDDQIDWMIHMPWMHCHIALDCPIGIIS